MLNVTVHTVTTELLIRDCYFVHECIFVVLVLCQAFEVHPRSKHLHSKLQ